MIGVKFNCPMCNTRVAGRHLVYATCSPGYMYVQCFKCEMGWRLEEEKVVAFK